MWEGGFWRHTKLELVCVFFFFGCFVLVRGIFCIFCVVVFHFLSFPYRFLEQCQKLLLKGFRFYSSSTFFVQNAL